MPYAACSRSFQPAPSPTSTRPWLIASICATVIANGPGRRNVTGDTSVPRPDRGRVAREPGERGPRVGRPGESVAAEEVDVVVGSEEGVEAELLAQAGERELVVVGRAFLGLDEDPEANGLRMASVYRIRVLMDPDRGSCGIRAGRGGGRAEATATIPSMQLWDRIVWCTNWVGEPIPPSGEPTHRTRIGAAGPAVLRSRRLPWVAPLEADWRSSARSSTPCSRASRRPAQLPGHLDRPGAPHRRRPMEDVLPLRLRLPQRRELRAVPGDRPRWSNRSRA